MAPASPTWSDATRPDTVEALVADDALRVPVSTAFRKHGPPASRPRTPQRPSRETAGRRHGKTGSRRANRADNDSFRGHPIAKDIRLTKEDVEELYNPYVEWRSAIGGLFQDAKALSAIEPFLNVTMEEEERLLRAQSARARRGSDSDLSDGWDLVSDDFVVVKTPSEMLARVDGRLRKLLATARCSDEDFLRNLEAQLRAHLHTSRESGPQVPLRLDAPEGPFYRLVCHGAAQFYGLSSKGVPNGEGGRGVAVSPAGPGSSDVSLVDALSA